MTEENKRAVARPTIQDRYEEVARKRRREEAIARRKAQASTPPIDLDPEVS
jgi:hypothetical protein